MNDFFKRLPKKFAIANLQRYPRFRKTITNILGYPVEIVDAHSFLFMYQEVFRDEIYKFKSEKSAPFIIDCGANIGVSILYFKQLFPEAKILAFEPDKNIFQTLSRNVHTVGLKNVTLKESAVWTESGYLDFVAEGADAGRLMASKNDKPHYQIYAESLKPYLSDHVDFLKIDIEGAETAVLIDCKSELKNVENLFVEYHSFLDRPQDLDQLLHILSTAGFRYYIQHPIKYKNIFIDPPDILGMDLQLNIFAKRY